MSAASALGATVYTNLSLYLKMLHLVPLAPNATLEPEFQSPPELGDLGGKKVSDANQRTCVYTIGFGEWATRRTNAIAPSLHSAL